MRSNDQIQIRPKPDGKPACWESTEAAKLAAQEQKSAARQLGALRARAAIHAAEIAEQDRHGPFRAVLDVRGEWAQMIRSMPAGANSVAGSSLDPSQFNWGPATANPPVERLSQVDNARFKPGEFMTDQAGFIDIWPPQGQLLTALYLESIAQNVDSLSPVTGKVPCIRPPHDVSGSRLLKTDRFGELLAQPLDCIDWTLPEPHQRIDSGAIEQSIQGTAASLQSPPLDHVAQVFPDAAAGGYSASISQSLAEATARAQPPPVGFIGPDSPQRSNEEDRNPMIGSSPVTVAAVKQHPVTAPWLNDLGRLPASDLTHIRAIQPGVSRHRDDPRFGDPTAMFEDHDRFRLQEIMRHVSKSSMVETPRALLMEAARLRIPQDRLREVEGTSLLSRERLVGVSERTHGTMDGNQGPQIDIDRLARVMEMFIRGLEKFTGIGHVPAIGPGRSETFSVPPALLAKPAPFAGRTDACGILY